MFAFKCYYVLFLFPWKMSVIWRQLNSILAQINLNWFKSTHVGRYTVRLSEEQCIGLVQYLRMYINASDVKNPENIPLWSYNNYRAPAKPHSVQ